MGLNWTSWRPTKSCNLYKRIEIMWELDNINIINESEVDDHEGRIKKVYDRPIKIIEG